MEFQDKLAVITGGSSGIGRAMALALARMGGRIAFCGTRECAIADTLHALDAISGGHMGQVVDVSDRDAVFDFAARVKAELGVPDLLFNNAGVGGEWGRLFERPQIDWNWTFGINVFGVVHCIEAFVGDMVASGRPGHVINTASIAGLLPGPSMGGYSPSKFAVVSLTEGLSAELEGTAVRAAVLCPGFVDTNLLDSGRKLDNAPDRTGESPEIEQRRAVVRQRMREAMSPEEVVERVFAALDREDRFIVTHPEFRSAFEKRVNEMLAAFDAASCHR